MGEKIAILTDIHGNRPALKAVLDDINQDKEISHIYCLGDLIGIGHETNQVLELLFQLENISFVMGNHDESILKLLDGKEPHSKGIEREHHEWIAERLDKKYVEQLSTIPKQLNVNISGKDFLFLHYHINDSGNFQSLEYEPSSEKLDQIYQSTDFDVVCFGHHHVVHHFKSKERIYLNPGSLGCGHKSLAPYATIEVGDAGQIDVTFKEVLYDNKGFLLSIMKEKFPAYEIVLRGFHGNQHLKFIDHKNF